MKNYIIIFSLILGMLFCFGTVSQGEAEASGIELSAKADKEIAYVGDRITFTVTAKKNKGYDVIFPKVPETLGNFTFVDSHPVRDGYEYVLSIYETGIQMIQPVKVKYKLSAEEVWKTLESPKASVEVKSVLTGEEKDIKDIKGILFLQTKVSRIFAGLVFLLFLGVLAWLFWYNKKHHIFTRRKKKILPPHEVAYQRLSELYAKELSKKGLVKEYYTELSDIIRQYLENRFNFRAPEMTTEEFLKSVKNSPELENQHRTLLKEFLSQCDMVKFAKYGPTQLEMIDSFKMAENFVDQTRFIPEEEEAKQEVNK